MADLPTPSAAVQAAESVIHIVQVALTPIFLLSGIGALLNVFNTRLSRVADHTEHTAELLESETEPGKRASYEAHLARLLRRRLVLDATMLLSSVAAACTCFSTLVLFLGQLRETVIASWLLSLFGTALICTAGALVAFLADGVLAWHGLHRDGPLPKVPG